MKKRRSDPTEEEWRALERFSGGRFEYGGKDAVGFQWVERVLPSVISTQQSESPLIALGRTLHIERFYPQNEPLDWWKESTLEEKANWIPAAHGNALTFNMPS